MPQVVEIDEIGKVEFSDDFTPEQIRTQVGKLTQQHWRDKRDKRARVGLPPEATDDEVQQAAMKAAADFAWREPPKPPGGAGPLPVGPFYADYQKQDPSQAQVRSELFAQIDKERDPSFARWLADQNQSLGGMANAAAQHAVAGVGDLAKGAAAANFYTVPVDEFGNYAPSYDPKTGKVLTGVDSPFYTDYARRITQAPGEQMKELRSQELFKTGQALTDIAPEVYPIPEREKGSLLTGAAEMAGGFAPLIASGPLAPLTMGVQSIGAHIDGDWQQAKAQGMSDDDAARLAMNRAFLSGGLQSTIFLALPKPLRMAGEKYLISRFGADTVGKFLATRGVLGTEGLILGAASTVAENVVAERDPWENVGEGAVGMGAFNLLLPPYNLPGRRPPLRPFSDATTTATGAGGMLGEATATATGSPGATAGGTMEFQAPPGAGVTATGTGAPGERAPVEPPRATTPLTDLKGMSDADIQERLNQIEQQLGPRERLDPKTQRPVPWRAQTTEELRLQQEMNRRLAEAPEDKPPEQPSVPSSPTGQKTPPEPVPPPVTPPPVETRTPEQLGNQYGARSADMERAGGRRQWYAAKVQESGKTHEDFYEEDKAARQQDRVDFRAGLEEGDTLEVSGEYLTVDPATGTTVRVQETKRFSVEKENGRLVAEPVFGQPGAGTGLEADSGFHFFNELEAPVQAGEVMPRTLRVVKAEKKKAPTPAPPRPTPPVESTGAKPKGIEKMQATVTLRVNEEILKTGKWPNGTKVSTDERQQIAAENEVLRKVLEDLKAPPVEPKGRPDADTDFVVVPPGQTPEIPEGFATLDAGERGTVVFDPRRISPQAVITAIGARATTPDQRKLRNALAMQRAPEIWEPLKRAGASDQEILETFRQAFRGDASGWGLERGDKAAHPDGNWTVRTGGPEVAFLLNRHGSDHSGQRRLQGTALAKLLRDELGIPQAAPPPGEAAAPTGLENLSHVELDELAVKGNRNERQLAARERERRRLPEAEPAKEEAPKLDAFGMLPPKHVLPEGHPLLVETLGKTELPGGGDRNAWRRQEIAKMLASANPKEKPILWLAGGGSAAGKDTLLGKLAEAGDLPREDVVYIDPDRAKTGDAAEEHWQHGLSGIPEYLQLHAIGDSRAASVTHEESGTAIAKAALREGIAGKRDIIYNATLSNPNSIKEYIDQAKANGYEVRLVGITVDVASALRRSSKRNVRSGRYVNPEFLIFAHKGFAKGWETYLKWVDAARLFDNSGTEPVEIARKAQGSELEILDPKAYVEFGRRREINEKATGYQDILPGEALAGEAVQGDAGGVAGAPAETRGEGVKAGTAPALEGRKELSPSQQVADFVIERLNRGEKFTSAELYRAADLAYGKTQATGGYTPKDAYDAMEAGVNRWLSGLDPNVDMVTARNTVSKLKTMLEKLPTQTARTAEADKMQQFSTPPSHSFAANWVAAIRPGEVMLEPSAGIGGLAVFAKNAGARVVANELSPRRAQVLRETGIADHVFEENAEHIHALLAPKIAAGEVPQPTVVVMNPPFSNAARTDSKSNMVGATHVEEAMKVLPEGGRLVAILGEGMAEGMPAFRSWWNKMKKLYNVRANVGIEGREYRKYGTAFGNNLIVIDKTGPTPKDGTVHKSVKYVEETLPLLESIRNDRPRIEQSSVERGGDGTIAPGGGSGASQSPASPELGAGQPGVGARPEGAGAGGLRPGGGGAAGGTKSSGKGSGRGGRKGDVVVEPSGQPPSDSQQAAAEGLTVSKLKDGRRQLKESGVFSEYSPAKIHVVGAKAPPTPLVESTAMASVVPPDPTYTPHLPAELIKSGGISLTSLENVIYAGQAHERMLPDGSRMGYFIGDGTGVGKGRQISGIFMDNWNQGRKRGVWVSKTGGLIKDAQRDMADIGFDVKRLIDLSEKEGAALDANPEGIGFITYTSLSKNHPGLDPASLAPGQTPRLTTTTATRQLAPIVPGTKVARYPVFTGAGLSGLSEAELATRAGSDLVQIEGEGKFGPDGWEYRGKNLKTGERERVVGKANWAVMEEGPERPARAEKISRMERLAKWLGPDFDGVIAFDEAHLAGNAIDVPGNRGIKKASERGKAVVDLQKLLPKARIVYVSATGATDVTNLSYADRLGIWGHGTPFPQKQAFFDAIRAGGLSAMEIVARDLKSMGRYLARTMSFEGVEQRQLPHKLTPEQVQTYNEASRAWQLVMEEMDNALAGSGGNNSGKARSAALSAFFGAQQRFYNTILTAMQMPSILVDMKKQLEGGNSILLQIVNTNEATLGRVLGERAASHETLDLESLDLSPKDALLQYVDNSFPVAKWEPVSDAQGNVRWEPVRDSEGNVVNDPAAVEAKMRLLDKLALMRMPSNPMEMILDTFGVDNVAEVTGRSRRVVNKVQDDGTVKRVLETNRGVSQRRVEADEFQEGKRRILVFSDAGGTGFSYHASRKSKNQQRRIHYLVQAGWRADQAVQGMGRSHRTDQASAPFYVLPSTDIKGHQRFISTIARRLSELGAITGGERKAAERGLFSEENNLENQYAEDAVFKLFIDLRAGQVEGVEFNDLARKMGYTKTTINARTGEKTTTNTLIGEGGTLNVDKIPTIQQFLNRVLVLEFDEQNRVFDAFSERMRQRINNAKADGSYDPGTQTLKSLGNRKLADDVVYQHPDSTAETRLVEIESEHATDPMPWDKLVRWSKTSDPVLVRNNRSGKLWAIEEGPTRTLESGAVVTTYRRHSPGGASDIVPRREMTEENFTPIPVEERQAEWDKEFGAAPKTYKKRTTYVVGAFLPIWDRIKLHSPQIWRVPLEGGETLLGARVPPRSVDALRARLGAGKGAKMTPEMAFADVLENGKDIVLANGWRLHRSRRSGENRIEISNVDYDQTRELTDYIGAFMERVNYQPRFYLPTDATGIESMRKILDKSPPVDEAAVAQHGMSGAEIPPPSGQEGVPKVAPGANANVKAGGQQAQPAISPEIAPGEVSHGFSGSHSVFQQMAADVAGIRAFMAPQTAGKSARFAGNLLRELNARMAVQMARADAALKVYQSEFDRTPVNLKKYTYHPAAPLPRNFAFIDAYETGNVASLPPKERAAAAELHRLNQADVARVQALGTGALTRFYTDYFPHIWDDPKRASALMHRLIAKAPLEGPKSFLKQRTHQLFEEGLRAGLKPVHDNPIDLWLLKKREIERYILAHDFTREMKAAGLMKFKYVFSRTPDGWATVNDKAFTVHGPPTVTIKEAFDAGMREATLDLLRQLGVPHERVSRLGREWGEERDVPGQPGTERIRTRFAGPDFVIWHELGHALHNRYPDLEQTLSASDLMKTELTALADARLDGSSSQAFRRNVHTMPEKMAVALQAYVHAPERMGHLAPTVKAALEGFIQAHPELAPINDIRPGLRMGVGEAELSHGGLLKLGEYIMPEPAAKLVNNFLSPGLNPHLWYRALRQVSNVLNGAQLGLSAFHLGFTSLDAATSRLAVGIEDIMGGRPASALKAILSTPVSPVTNIRTGAKLRAEVLRPGTHPEMAALARAMEKAGGRIGMDAFWATEFTRRMMRAWHRGGVQYLTMPLRLPLVLWEQSMRPILEYVVPRQKLGVFADMAKRELLKLGPHAGEAETREAMRKAWDSVDNRMGQVVYDNLFHNRTVKDVALLSFRAYGWQLGKYREGIGAVVDAMRAAGKIARGQRPEFTHRMAYAMALPLMVGTIGGMIHYLLTGQAPQSLIDYFQPQTGEVDKNGNPVRLNLPSYVKDAISYAKHPITSFAHSLNPLISGMFDLLQNKDFYNTQIRNPDDPLWQQGSDVAQFAAKQFVPFSVSGATKLAEEQAPAWKRILPFFGITPVPGRLTMSPSQELAAEIMAARMPQGAQTKEKFDEARARGEIVDLLRRGQAEQGLAKLKDAVDARTLTKGQLFVMMDKLKWTPYQFQVHMMSSEDAMRVWRIAKPEERAAIRHLVLHKLYKSKTLSKDERVALGREVVQDR